MSVNITTESAGTPPQQPPVALPELILSLEQASTMAKQLPSTTDPNHLLQIYSCLQQAHHHLSSFFSHTHFPTFPPPPLPTPYMAAENSLSSATGAAAAAGEEEDEPMQAADDDYEAGAEENSRLSIDRVEERMRDCFIKNKRPKRPLSPSSAAAEEKRAADEGYQAGVKGFDPHGTRLRALDLIYQFHG